MVMFSTRSKANGQDDGLKKQVSFFLKNWKAGSRSKACACRPSDRFSVFKGGENWLRF